MWLAQWRIFDLFSPLHFMLYTTPTSGLFRGRWNRETRQTTPDQTEVLEHGWTEGAPSKVVLDGWLLLGRRPRDWRQQQQRGRGRDQSESDSSDDFSGVGISINLWRLLWSVPRAWCHVLASHWCRADVHGSVNRVLWACRIWLRMPCLSCGYHGNAHLSLYCMSDFADRRWNACI